MNVEMTGLSQVPGQPPCSVCTCSSTPARRFAPDQFRNDRMAPAKGTTKALASRTFEAQSHGFRTSYLRFVTLVTSRNARLASGRWSGATGRAFHPQGHNRRFQIHIMLIILLRQASWRNPLCFFAVFRSSRLHRSRSKFVLSSHSVARWQACLCIPRAW